MGVTLKKKKKRVNKNSRKEIKKPKRLTRSKNHCSPAALKNQVVQGSCFTKQAIETIANAHNKHNSNKQININLSSKDKWIELRKHMSRIPKCDQDKCWLQNIPLNDREQNMLKAQLFVPPRPSEWKKDPNSWLTNFDIEKVLNQYEEAHPQFHFIGPSPIDYDTRPDKKDCVCNKLCNLSIKQQLANGKKKIGIVFNLDPHNKGGSHWVAMFIDLEDKFVFYFNSTGQRIQPQINKFKNNILRQGKPLLGKMNYYTNKYEHQRSNTECGLYCLYFIITCLLREIDILKNQKRSGGAIERMSVKELVKFFTGPRIPDKLVQGYRTELFRGGTQVPPSPLP
jgi:hypothetical protein